MAISYTVYCSNPLLKEDGMLLAQQKQKITSYLL